MVLSQVSRVPILKLKHWRNYKKIFKTFLKCCWRMASLKWKRNLLALKQLW